MSNRRFLILVLLVAATAASGQTMTSHLVARLRAVTSAEISPDGSSIAYILAVPRGADEPDGAAHRELWVVPFGGGEARGFVTGAGSVGSIGWTADGKRVLFTRRDGDDPTTLYGIPIDGGEAKPLFKPKASVRAYAVSRDGRWAAYTCRRKKSDSHQALAKKGFNQIIFGEQTRPVDLWLVDLASGGHTHLPLDGAPWELAFSPKGEHLALWVSPSPSIDDRYMKRRLWVYDLKVKEGKQATKNPGKVGDLAWSPDGKHIAFVSGTDIHDPKESSLMVVPAAGGEARNLTPAGFEGHVEHIAWRNAETVAFTASEGCRTSLNIQSIRGGARGVVLRGERRIFDSLSLARGDRAAMLVSHPSHPPEVYTVNGADGGVLTRVTHCNPALEGIELAKQEVVEYEARDGLKVEGLLMYPLTYRKGQRYPLIVQVHGGPESHYQDGWNTSYSTPGQVAAAQGYFVFYPNYRSSTGRGVAFSKAGQGRSAHEEFDDLVDGIDYLAEKGLVDKKRVGITGGSYGGYASAWGATYYSERFAASVMFVGISEQISKVFTTDIPNESYYSHWRMRPWGNWDKYLKASPIYYVERAKTPILIAHGQDDPRVPVNQSIELYRALKIKGDVPVRLVLYPGEGHGNRKAAARLDYSLRQMRWFNHYLKGGGGDPPPADLNYGKASRS